MYSFKFNCNQHKGEPLILVSKDPDVSGLFCYQCADFQKNFVPIWTLYQKLQETNTAMEERDKSQTAAHEKYSAMIFSKDENLSELSNHLQSEKAKIDTFFEKFIPKITKTLNEIRNQWKDQLENRLIDLENEYMVYDELISKFSPKKLNLLSIDHLKQKAASIEEKQEFFYFFMELRKEWLSNMEILDSNLQTKINQLETASIQLQSKIQYRPKADYSNAEELNSLLLYLQDLKKKNLKVKHPLEIFEKFPFQTVAKINEEYQFQNSGLTVLNNCEEPKWLQFVGSLPIPQSEYEFQVRIDNTTNEISSIIIGISPFHIRLHEDKLYNCQGTYAITQNKKFFWNGSVEKLNPHPGLFIGDILTVTVNLMEGKIEFLKDGDIIGSHKILEAYRTMPYCLYIALRTKNSQITLISH